MAKGEDKKTIDVPNSAKKKAAEDFVIHVMPKEFKGQTAVLKTSKAISKTKPPVPPKPKPVPKPPVQKKPVKPKRRFPIIESLFLLIVLALIVGAVVFGVLTFLTNPTDTDEPIVDTPVEPDPPEEPEMPPEPPEEPEITHGVDTDSDGLTDVEERLYGTDFRNADTDADTFNDGNEVFHRYDPLGFAPSTLLDTGTVDIYTSDQGPVPFQVYYPASWQIQESIDPLEGMSEVQFVDRSSAFIALMTVENTNGETFEDWYANDAQTDVDFDELLFVVSKEGYDTFTTPDTFITYLETEGYVFIFTYDVTDVRSIEYLKTFQMMVNSFLTT